MNGTAFVLTALIVLAVLAGSITFAYAYPARTLGISLSQMDLKSGMYRNLPQFMQGLGSMMSSMMGQMMGGGDNSNHYQGCAAMMAAASSGSPVTVIMNDGFYPQTLKVKKGTTVTWVNMGLSGHTVTSGAHENPTKVFDSGLMSHMGTFSFTFAEAGTYAYHCEPHPYMMGTIIVE